jgi:hypothetical protein
MAMMTVEAVALGFGYKVPVVWRLVRTELRVRECVQRRVLSDECCKVVRRRSLVSLGLAELLRKGHLGTFLQCVPRSRLAGTRLVCFHPHPNHSPSTSRLG